jgi:hypothetical protein
MLVAGGRDLPGPVGLCSPVAAISKLARYREISPLGSGGMAAVVLAQDMTLGRLVALKRVHELGDGRGRSRVRREALVGASLSHPNLVSVYDVVEGEDGEQVIVMEYVEGETLRDALGRGSGLAVAEALWVIGGVGAGLDAIHRRGIVHRDVKPANILLGSSGAVKLADLGIASAVDRTRITTDGAVLGTFSYMAPEQLDGARPSAAVDVYALAAVAFEVLSGRTARLERNPVALAHALATKPPPDLSEAWRQAPRAAVELLAGGMSRDPSRRPRSAGELAGRLRAALEPQATAPIPIPAGEVLATGRATARTPTSHRGAAPASAAPRASPGSSRQDEPAAALGGQRTTRRDGGGAPARGRRADAGLPAGAEQPSDRRRAPVGPVIATNGSASTAGSSRAAITAAPNAAARPSSARRADEPVLRPAHAQLTAVAWHRGRSRARILAAASIAFAAAAVVLAVTITGSGSQPPPRGATASRRVSPPSSHSRTTTTTSTPLTGPAPTIAATQSNSSPASTAPAATDPSVPPATGETATGARSPATHRTTTTAPSHPPADTSTAPARDPTTATLGSPVSAVESFYQLAATHRYIEAWALADPTFRSQLGGYNSFQAGQAGDRSITFDAAHVTSQSSTNATVAVHTTSVRTNRTQHCAGTIDLVSGSTSGGWLLHLIHINCT